MGSKQFQQEAAQQNIQTFEYLNVCEYGCTVNLWTYYINPKDANYGRYKATGNTN
jgi:hypothetical protein